jgi:hypothetical protein
VCVFVSIFGAEPVLGIEPWTHSADTLPLSIEALSDAHAADTHVSFVGVGHPHTSPVDVGAVSTGWFVLYGVLVSCVFLRRVVLCCAVLRRRPDVRSERKAQIDKSSKNKT